MSTPKRKSTKTKIAHTPTPWTVGDDDANGQVIIEGPDFSICKCHHHCVGTIELEMRANAEFIVRAVNSHEDLIAALEEIAEVLSSWRAHQCPGFDCATCQGSRLQEVARAALAKAETP